MLLRAQDLDERRLFADCCCFGMVATAIWNFLCQANSTRPLVGVIKSDSNTKQICSLSSQLILEFMCNRYSWTMARFGVLKHKSFHE
jgi:hypothetical protein